MRTNIDINNKLIKTAQKLSRTKTKKQVVHLALENLVRTLNKHQLLDLFGKVRWEGNLTKMRG